MTRRETILSLMAAGIASADSASVDAAYSRAMVIDTMSPGGAGYEPQLAIDAGLTALVADLPTFPRNYPSAMKAMADWKAAFDKEPKFLPVLTASDLDKAKSEKRLGIILASQDAAILDASTSSVNDYNLDVLRRFHKDGLRVLQLTHNERNSVGDSFREKSNTGLSRLGEKVVAEMNRLKMMIDVSHCGDRTTEEAIELSKSPIAITHAGCRSLYATGRNKTDAQIKAVANRGGYFGVYNMSIWLTDKPTADINSLIDHIDHAVKLAGIEHVGFGSDGPALALNTTPEQMLAGHVGYWKRNAGLPGAEREPKHVIIFELNTPLRLRRLAEGLDKRGYKTGEIEKILGGNFARIFRDICG